MAEASAEIQHLVPALSVAVVMPMTHDYLLAMPLKLELDGLQPVARAEWILELKGSRAEWPLVAGAMKMWLVAGGCLG